MPQSQVPTSQSINALEGKAKHKVSPQCLSSGRAKCQFTQRRLYTYSLFVVGTCSKLEHAQKGQAFQKC